MMSQEKQQVSFSCKFVSTQHPAIKLFLSYKNREVAISEKYVRPAASRDYKKSSK